MKPTFSPQSHGAAEQPERRKSIPLGASVPLWLVFLLFALAFSLQPSAFPQTAVQFPLNSLFGGAAYDKPLTITAANTLISDGQNLWAGTYTIVPASTTNPVVNLYPNTYLLTIPGVVKPARFTVPASANVLDVTTLLTSGPLFYFGTNGMINLWPGGGIAFTTNADGSITVSSGGVTNNQVLSGVPIVTNASGISGIPLANTTGTLPLAQLPGIVVTNASLSYIPAGTIDWWAGDLIPGTNGQPLTDWIGIFGNTLHGKNATLDKQMAGGHASVNFAGTGILTNAAVVYPSLTNQYTVFFVYKFHKPATMAGATQQFPLSFGLAYPPSFRFQSLMYTLGIWFGAAQTTISAYSGITPLIEYFNCPGGFDKVYVYACTYNTNCYRDWIDGKVQCDTTVPPFTGVSPNSGISNAICIGSDFGMLCPWTGYVAEVGICSNSLSNDQIDKVNASLLAKYELIQPGAVVLDGDSMMAGGYSTWNSTPADLLTKALPGVSFGVTAVPGRSSAQDVINITNWVGSSAQSANKVVWFWTDLVNGNETWQTAATNTLLEAASAHANGWKFVMTIPPSSITADTTDNSRAGFWSWATNNYSWTNFADGLVDFSRDPLVGGYLAYLNTSNYPVGGVHWTNSVYNECINGFAAPVIRNVLYGSWTCTQTSTPPPTVNQPWTATDPNAPGVTFANNGGAWVPMAQGNIALTLQSSLDDFMNIDQYNTADQPTADLPATTGGNIFGKGKFGSGGGSWVFYFDPPRWPLFQVSGFTNQVFAIHVWVTNAATINYQANLRYFTNGLGNAGGGSQTKTIGSGVFQCGPGTNDYWILATNSFSSSIMTNVQLAEFYFGNLSPSTNCWVIQGTKIHAQ